MDDLYDDIDYPDRGAVEDTVAAHCHTFQSGLPSDLYDHVRWTQERRVPGWAEGTGADEAAVSAAVPEEEGEAKLRPSDLLAAGRAMTDVLGIEVDVRLLAQCLRADLDLANRAMDSAWAATGVRMELADRISRTLTGLPWSVDAVMRIPAAHDRWVFNIEAACAMADPGVGPDGDDGTARAESVLVTLPEVLLDVYGQATAEDIENATGFGDLADGVAERLQAGDEVDDIFTRLDLGPNDLHGDDPASRLAEAISAPATTTPSMEQPTGNPATHIRKPPGESGPQAQAPSHSFGARVPPVPPRHIAPWGTERPGR